MGRIRAIDTTDIYKKISTETKKADEGNDCSVKALALVTGQKYAVAQKALAKKGRKKGEGIESVHIVDAVKEAGFTVKEVGSSHFIEQYPGVHVNLKNVTTHHPDRFPRAWADGHTYLAFTAGHALAIIDGYNHDHTRGSAKRVIRIYRVEKAA